MSFLDLAAKAKRFAKREGDFIAGDQQGTLLIKDWSTHKTQGGNIAVMLAELVEVRPKITGGTTQAVGSLVKIMYCFYGSVKRVQAQQAEFITSIVEVTGCKDEEVPGVLREIFSDAESGLSADASDDLKSRPTFGARGMLVDFESKTQADTNAKGEHYVRTRLKHRTKGNSDEEILARQKAL